MIKYIALKPGDKVTYKTLTFLQGTIEKILWKNYAFVRWSDGSTDWYPVKKLEKKSDD